MPDATIKSNILTRANDAGSVGVCSDAMNHTINADKIKDYGFAVLEGGCTVMISQAD